MEELIEIIDKITKYGLNPNIDNEDKEKDLVHCNINKIVF